MKNDGSSLGDATHSLDDGVKIPEVLYRVPHHLLRTLSEKRHKVNWGKPESQGKHVSETRTPNYSEAGPDGRRIDHETQKRI